VRNSDSLRKQEQFLEGAIGLDGHKELILLVFRSYALAGEKMRGLAILAACCAAADAQAEDVVLKSNTDWLWFAKS